MHPTGWVLLAIPFWHLPFLAPPFERKWLVSQYSLYVRWYVINWSLFVLERWTTSRGMVSLIIRVEMWILSCQPDEFCRSSRNRRARLTQWWYERRSGEFWEKSVHVLYFLDNLNVISGAILRNYTSKRLRSNTFNIENLTKVTWSSIHTYWLTIIGSFSEEKISSGYSTGN